MAVELSQSFVENRAGAVDVSFIHVVLPNDLFVLFIEGVSLRARNIVGH